MSRLTDSPDTALALFQVSSNAVSEIRQWWVKASRLWGSDCRLFVSLGSTDLVVIARTRRAVAGLEDLVHSLRYAQPVGPVSAGVYACRMIVADPWQRLVIPRWGTLILSDGALGHAQPGVHWRSFGAYRNISLLRCSFETSYKLIERVRLKGFRTFSVPIFDVDLVQAKQKRLSPPTTEKIAAIVTRVVPGTEALAARALSEMVSRSTSTSARHMVLHGSTDLVTVWDSPSTVDALELCRRMWSTRRSMPWLVSTRTQIGASVDHSVSVSRIPSTPRKDQPHLVSPFRVSDLGGGWDWTHEMSVLRSDVEKARRVVTETAGRLFKMNRAEARRMFFDPIKISVVATEDSDQPYTRWSERNHPVVYFPDGTLRSNLWRLHGLHEVAHAVVGAFIRIVSAAVRGETKGLWKDVPPQFEEWGSEFLATAVGLAYHKSDGSGTIRSYANAIWPEDRERITDARYLRLVGGVFLLKLIERTRASDVTIKYLSAYQWLLLIDESYQEVNAVLRDRLPADLLKERLHWVEAKNVVLGAWLDLASLTYHERESLILSTAFAWDILVALGKTLVGEFAAFGRNKKSSREVPPTLPGLDETDFMATFAIEDDAFKSLMSAGALRGLRSPGDPALKWLQDFASALSTLEVSTRQRVLWSSDGEPLIPTPRSAADCRNVRQFAVAEQSLHCRKQAAGFSQLRSVVPAARLEPIYRLSVRHGPTAPLQVGAESLAEFRLLPLRRPNRSALGAIVAPSFASSSVRYPYLVDQFVQPAMSSYFDTPRLRTDLVRHFELELACFAAIRQKVSSTAVRGAVITFNVSPNLLLGAEAAGANLWVDQVIEELVRVIRAIRRRGGQPVMELTEGAISDVRELGVVLREVRRRAGLFGLAIDDQHALGTDHRRLASLISIAHELGLSPNYVKIDRAAVTTAMASPQTAVSAFRSFLELSQAAFPNGRASVIFEGFGGDSVEQLWEHRARMGTILLAACQQLNIDHVFVQGEPC